MEGADVAVLYMDKYQGYATDYNITAKSTVRPSFFPLLNVFDDFFGSTVRKRTRSIPGSLPR